MSDEEKLDLIGCGVYIGCRWSKQDTIAELEKIKAEMEVLHNNYKINIQGYSMSVARECMDIIDQRISELEGENNE
ncbi:MAG: hypothetical protein J6R32_02435 [Bacteroidales bacterium]|nr:hypothetical protein [Bacteroidales bacterium]